MIIENGNEGNDFLGQKSLQMVEIELEYIKKKRKNDDAQFRNEKLIDTSCGGGMGIMMK